MKPPIPSKTASTQARSTVRPDQATAARELAAHSSPGRALIGKRILLVDDDPAVRDSLNDVLVSEGCVVIPAENGQQALDLAAGFAVDLALLDLNMPVKNGWDTFEQLTFEHPLIPVIIVTARPNQLFTALAAGAGALLEKPMDIPTLLRTMEKLLAEPAGQRLARLAGGETEFHYKSATAGQGVQPPGKTPLMSSNEEQTSETDTPGDSHDFQANRESNLPPFNVVVSSGNFRDNGIRAAHWDSPAAALLGAAAASSFAGARS